MRAMGLPRLFSLITVLAFSTTACGLFAIQNEVGLKKVGVDLSFGGTLPEPPVTPTLPPLPEPPTFEFPEPPPPPPPLPPLPDLCPPTSALGPRDEVQANIEYPDQAPEEGNYLFSFQGNFEDEGPRFSIANKVVSNVAQEGDGFFYSVQDGFNRIRMTFEARPVDEISEVTDGLYLRKIEIPEEPPPAFSFQAQPRLLEFEPATPMKLVDFPVTPGTTIRSQAIDVSPKSTTPIVDPITGAPLLSPSGNRLRSAMTVDAAERFPVCEELGHGYKAAWDLEITGEFNLRILGTFWLATQYGGWPIKDEYVVIGDLIPGNFSSNMMKLDPGDHLEGTFTGEGFTPGGSP